MIALYFTSQEGSFAAFEEDMRHLEEQYELQEERWRAEKLAEVKRNVSSMSAKDAKDMLIRILYNDALDDRYRNDYW